MQTFQFPEVKYRLYKNTFLQNVMVTFEFLSANNERTNAAFVDYLKSFFEIEAKDSSLINGVTISKKDMSVSLSFSTNKAAIHLNGQKYVGFSDTAIPQVFKLRNFFTKVMNVTTLQSISIRKVNVWNIKQDIRNAVRVEDAYKAIFSDNLINALSNVGLSEEERAIPNFQKAYWKVNTAELIVRTALLPPSKTKDQFCHLILDTEIIDKPTNGYKVENVASDMMDLNSTLYDAFHWCVCNDIINLMSKE